MRRLHTSALFTLPLVLSACAYDALVDPDYPGLGNQISGEVITDQLAASGPAFLLIAPADNPTPPLGTGSPLTFSSVPAGAFEVGVDGLAAAPFAITGLPDGEFYLTGLLDQDRNFHPSAPTLAGASCGDVSGAYIDGLATQQLTTLKVEGGEWLRSVPLPLARVQTTSRPAFTYDAGPLVFGGQLTLTATPITASYGPDLRVGIPGPFDPTAAEPDTCEAAFWYRRVDADGDGNVDRDPDNPLAERKWPRVLLRWMGVPADANGDGAIDSFERTINGEPVPASTIYATSATPSPPAGIPEPPANQVFPLLEMNASISPAGRLINDETGAAGTIIDIAEMPPGAYSITIIAETGQTWQVPNELAKTLVVDPVPPPGVTSPPNPSQGSYLLLE